MSDDGKCHAATPRGTLLEQIMDSSPKSEREWAAAAEIERKDAVIAELVEALNVIASGTEDEDRPFRAIGTSGPVKRIALAAIAKHYTPKEPS